MSTLSILSGKNDVVSSAYLTTDPSLNCSESTKASQRVGLSNFPYSTPSSHGVICDRTPWDFRYNHYVRSSRQFVQQPFSECTAIYALCIVQCSDNTQNLHRSTVERIPKQFTHQRSKVNLLATHKQFGISQQVEKPQCRLKTNFVYSK